ncbi:conserved membrane domain protein [Mycobacterium xenopi 3993]|nr:conserved membrane domain protein [Mycobacterium xenopi 3993]
MGRCHMLPWWPASSGSRAWSTPPAPPGGCPGALVDVDGATGEIRLLELADHTAEIDSAATNSE